MANTTYKELCNSVYSKIKDYDFIQMEEEEADEIIIDYLRPAIVAFEDCSQDLSDRDPVNKTFNIELDDVNFEILTHFMVVYYLDATYIKTPLALSAHMSTKDFHKYDNANVLPKAQAVREMYWKEAHQLMINYSIRRGDLLSNTYEELGGYGYTANKYAKMIGHPIGCCCGCCYPKHTKLRWKPPICGQVHGV